ncbi:MAG TPA: adenine deaminase [Candidatus Caldiarchaeum subterraneum]|uniref:Adenine deaminase n=1 Tax=Caldiarchaeum subterraneum TaxID=311458 RepID=A0A832ZWK2_CALS0|nr:adenine deaminase [Candidatus Caldarchaeum subterraneum]
MRIQELIEAAQGKRRLSLLIQNVDVLNIFTGELIRASIGIYGDRIAYVGPDSMDAEKTIDGNGLAAVPGLIDTHLHIESSMVVPSRFAEAVLPHGTTTVCADPHEIANVLGKDGIRMMLENAKDLPMKIYFFASTCVPESNAVTAGAEIKPEDVEEMLEWEGIVGLGEVMDYEGVVNNDPKMVKILEIGHKHNAVIDGHCVLLQGAKLNAYVAVGPEADHENFTVETALDKLRAGMYLKLRGPYILDTRKFVQALKQLPNPWNIILVTDDVMPDNLIDKGHLDHVVRAMIDAGMDEVEAVRSVTYRPAQHMRMYNLGAIAPGKIADIILLKNLRRFEIDTVISNGVVVAKEQRLLVNIRHKPFDDRARNTVKLQNLSIDDFYVKPPVENGKVKVHVIDFTKYVGEIADPAAAFLDMILTKLNTAEVEVRNGDFILGDVALVLVFERHGKNRNRGVGFVRNLIHKGAVASTIAHDSHNMIVVGTNREDMYKAAQLVIESRGGTAAIMDSRTLAHIQLPIAGLMSEEQVEKVAEKMKQLRRAFKEMQVLDHPYMPLINLLTLSVIPHARITDKGIFDVNRQQFIPWIAE